MKENFELTVIVPFYNEEKFFYKSVSELMKQKFITEIILVNDASTDDSLRIANEMLNQDKRLSLINLKKNSGKGNAVKEALKEVQTSHVIVHDADLEYFPDDIPEMFNQINPDKDCLVLGSRTIGSKERINLYVKNKKENTFKAITIPSYLKIQAYDMHRNVNKILNQ